MAVAGFPVRGLVSHRAQSTLRFYDSDETNFAGFKAPTNITADMEYTLPTAAPSVNLFLLQSTTAGVLSWSAYVGTGDVVRSNGPTITDTILDGSTTVGDLNITGSVTGAAVFAGALAFNSINSPSAYSTNQNNLALGTYNVFRVDAVDSTYPNITGLNAGGISGRLMLFVNIAPGLEPDSSTRQIIFTHEDANSSAANRFLNPSAANFSLLGGHSVLFWHDPVSSRWRIIATGSQD